MFYVCGLLRAGKVPAISSRDMQCIYVMTQLHALQTVSDAEAMLEACRAANVQWMDGTMLSHNPRLAKMEAAKPDLGELKTVTTLFCFCGGCKFNLKGWLP